MNNLFKKLWPFLSNKGLTNIIYRSTLAGTLFLCVALTAPASAQSDLIITGVLDGPLSGGLPKMVELQAINNVSDLSIYGIGSANNGGGSDGEEFTFPVTTVSAGSFIYLASEEPGFIDFFGFAPDYTTSAANINGDDAIELFQNGSVVDVFGDINVDGTGQPWEHTDGWAKRVGGTGPDGTTFVLANWTFSGVDALDGETSNATAANPFPIILPVIPNIVISGVIDGPLSGGTPKAIEFFVLNDIADLSTYGFGSANNGGGSDGEEFSFPADVVTAGTYFYVASEATEFNNFFGFTPDYTTSSAAINGDDAIELFQDGGVIDVFGDINIDGSGQPWDYADGWAKRVSGTGPDGSTFVLANWLFSGPDALDGETSNATAATPFPLPGVSGSTDLIITGVIDGPLSGGVPKAVEFLALNNITDLSVYGFGSANNGGGSDGEEFSFPADPVDAGTYIYVASEATGFQDFFEFAPNYTSGAANINGDDAIELFFNGDAVDVFGDINVDGSGQPWDYTDGWAKRIDGTGPDGTTFVPANWTFSGPNALDGESTNATAATPFPLIVPGTPNLIITGIVDGPLSGGVPKAVEFYVLNDITDLSDYGFGSANNGGGSDGQEFTFSSVTATAGSFIYVASEATGFTDFFGFAPDFTSGTANVNGDDAIELFFDGEVVDVFGDINVDGTGQPWEYLDGWAYRKNGTGPDGATFILSNWTFSGPNALDGESTNTTAATPIPIGSYSTSPDPVIAEIFEIQGSGLASPFINQIVISENNVVTAVGPEGFFMQTPAARSDGDINTSDGIYVFTNGAPGVSVGDLVDVTGEIVEFFEFTEFSEGSAVAKVGTGTVPTAVAFDASTPSPDPNTPSCSVNNYECFEGMLVEIAEGTVSSSNQRFASDIIAEVHISATSNRVLREPGIEFPGLSGLPVWDGNPEIFELDPDKLGLPNDTIPAGSAFAATGVIGFEFGGYELWPTSLNVTDASLPVTVRAKTSDEATIGSLNLFRLFDDVDDAGGDQVVSAAEYARRLTKFSLYFRNVLNAPDILAVQEVEKLGVLEDLADKISTDDPTINYTAYLEEGNDIGGIDVGFLVRDNVQVDAITQLGLNEIFAFDNSLLHDRPPLLLEGSFITSGENSPIAVMVVHNRSLGGIDDPSDGNRVRLKRLAQAEYIAQAVQDLQTTDPDVRLVVTGDFNAFEFTDGYVDAVGRIAGNFDDNDDLVSAPDDFVNPDLTNQVLSIPAEERYSFIFQGNGQVLDHALTSVALNSAVTEFAYGRGNCDAAVDYINDDSTPLRSSDHDGLVLFIDVTPPTIVVQDEPIKLWPPNHNYQTIEVSDFVNSISDGESKDISIDDIFITYVTSDEDENGDGDGNTVDDIVISDCKTVNLRSERNGGSNGRVYTINIAAADVAGNIGTSSFQVHVPQSKKKYSIDDGPVYEVQSNCSVPQTLSKSNKSEVVEANIIPDEFSLEQNYPNPFNPETRIQFNLPEAGNVEISVYNMLGQRIRNLVNSIYQAGYNSVNWDGKDNNGDAVSSGIYLYQLRVGNFVEVRKMTLLR